MTPDHVPEVAIKGFSWGAAGSWLTFIAVLGGIATFVRAVGPARILELLLNRNRELRSEQAAEDASLSARVAALEDRLARMGQAITFVISAATTSTNALESVDPDNPGIAQGRELLGFAASALGAEDPFSRALESLARVPARRTKRETKGAA